MGPHSNEALIQYVQSRIGVIKKVIVSQRNVNQISYISILQFGENYGLGHKGELGFSLNRSFNNHVIKILQLFNLWELAFWHHLT